VGFRRCHAVGQDEAARAVRADNLAIWTDPQKNPRMTERAAAAVTTDDGRVYGYCFIQRHGRRRAAGQR
jgi:hypothetical protein